LRAGSLRLLAPSTLTGAWSPLIQGVPPLYVALSGFDYPLSGFLLQVLGIHLSGPSILGVFPFRALFPLPSWTPFQGLCSPDLFPFAFGESREGSAFRALFPTASLPRVARCYTDNGVATLLGFCIFEASLFRPCRLTTAPLLHFKPVSKTPARCSRVFLSKTRLDFKKKSANPSDVFASSVFQTVGYDWQRGLMVSPNETCCITTLSPSFLALPKRAC
jgi:hypothetical protein